MCMDTIEAHMYYLRHSYIIKLSAYGIQDSTCKIPMDCNKFHVICDMMLLLFTDRSICQQYSHKLSHCSYIEL